MKKKIMVPGAMLFVALFTGSTCLNAQAVIQSGGDKVEVKGKEVKISSNSSTGGNITITGSGKERETYDGNGKNVTISGSNHDIRITGYPSSISISGSNNAVYTDGAKSISASGSNNAVTYYQLINKKKPAISISGHNNSVVKATL